MTALLPLNTWHVFTLYLKLRGEDYYPFVFFTLYFLLSISDCKTPLCGALHEEESLSAYLLQR